MRDVIAGTCRFIGAISIVIGAIFILAAGGSYAVPYVFYGIAWMVANYGLAPFAAMVMCVGFGLFHVGEMIKPFKSSSPKVTSNK